MTEPEELEDDLFADLYEADDTSAKPNVASDQGFDAGAVPAIPEPAVAPEPVPLPNEPPAEPSDAGSVNITLDNQDGEEPGNANANFDEEPHQSEDHKPIGSKEDGKMFIGGLNWETTDQSLRDYFSQFGEVADCMVMRDNATGRSRGFGFLTFKDARTVNVVMVKEHYLDGKIIDPKRAIPRDEQERTSKIFVGGVSQEANEQVFKEYFAQYGRIVDATLMMDKDTGRPRGFGFVTFDNESAVENVLNGDLTILGKPIEVKKAQPRGDMTEGGGESLGRGGRGRNVRKFDNQFDGGNNAGMNGNQFGNANQQGGGFGGGMGSMTPQMMAQYWQKMQQYFVAMQQQMAAMGGMGGGMNPAMMQQMQQMQQMQMMKQMQMAQQGGGQENGGQMNPQMMQQMQQMQQQMMAQQGGGGGGGGGGGRGTPGFNPQDQMAFEQQKYERSGSAGPGGQGNYPTGPASMNWEGGGGYDEGSEMGGGGGGGLRGRGRGRGGIGPDRTNSGPHSTAPANAPTGPKNAGRPGANYRGGGRGAHRGYHPYAR